MCDLTIWIIVDLCALVFMCDLLRVAQQAYPDLDRLVVEVSLSHTDTSHSVGLLWSRNRRVPETSAP